MSDANAGAAAHAGRRIPSLDGLRTVSIVMVLSMHLIGTDNFVRRLPSWVNIAELGVRVFFVISGYLISSLLFVDRERIEAGKAQAGSALWTFYVRRVYRLFPAAYAFVALIAILSAAGVITLKPGDLFAATTYTMNYHQPRSWWVGHLWSLSVEEQFYLLWPAAVLLAGRRASLVGAALAVLAAPAIRVALWYGVPQWRELETFPTIFDALGIGCLLAGGREFLGRQAVYLRLLRSPLFWIFPAGVMLANVLADHPLFDMVVGQSVQNIGIALLIDRSIRFPETAWGRFLNTRPMVYVGTLSYSLYLWQQLFLNRHSDSWTADFPVNLVFAVVAAFVSYTFIEQPFLRLRARRTAGRRIPA